MSARVVIVHDEQEFMNQACDALQRAGYKVIAYADTLQALTGLRQPETVELLITRVKFPEQPQGINLAAMTLSQRPNIKVLFTALPEYTNHLVGVGAFLVLPVTMSDLVGAVDQLLRPSR